MMTFSSMTKRPASANSAEASFSCAQSASTFTMTRMDAIFMASIIICALISLVSILVLGLSLLILALVLLIMGQFHTPMTRRTA